MKKTNEYYLIDWPEYQEYMEHPDWSAETDACTNESNPSAVFVPKHIVVEIGANDRSELELHNL